MFPAGPPFGMVSLSISPSYVPGLRNGTELRDPSKKRVLGGWLHFGFMFAGLWCGVRHYSISLVRIRELETETLTIVERMAKIVQVGALPFNRWVVSWSSRKRSCAVCDATGQARLEAPHDLR